MSEETSTRKIGCSIDNVVSIHMFHKIKQEIYFFLFVCTRIFYNGSIYWIRCSTIKLKFHDFYLPINLKNTIKIWKKIPLVSLSASGVYIIIMSKDIEMAIW